MYINKFFTKVCWFLKFTFMMANRKLCFEIYNDQLFLKLIFIIFLKSTHNGCYRNITKPSFDKKCIFENKNATQS